MAKTPRVMSGSLTKGSTATPSGSIIYSYQGINARTTTSYFGSLLPRIGSGDRLKLYKSGQPISEKYFDDESTLSIDPTDMRTSVSGAFYETRIGFDLERLTFGQAPTTQQGEPFADIKEFDAVAYLTDPGLTMWPVNLWNLGTLPDHEFDGVIEPFDIRRSILGEVDLRFEGHAPRGSLTGPFSENPFGSTEITGEWKKSDKPLSPFFDGPNQLARDRNRDLPVVARMTYDESQLYPSTTASFVDPNSAMPLQGYQGLERELLNPFVSQDYHDVIYSGVRNHNPPLTFMSQSAYDLNAGWSARSYTYAAYPNLIAWWRLNEVLPATLAQDSGPFNLTGSIGANITQYASFLPGTTTIKGGHVADFTAQKNLLEFNEDSASFVQFPGGNTGTGRTWDELIGGYYDHNTSTSYLKDFSMAAWIRQPSSTMSVLKATILEIGSDRNAVFPANNTTGGWFVELDQSGTDTINVGRYGAGGQETIQYEDLGPFNAAGKAWIHIAFTAELSKYDEATSFDNFVCVYINGVKATTLASGYPSSQGTRLREASITTNVASLGKTIDGANTGFYRESIADVALFDRVISQHEVAAIYNATLGGPRRVVTQQDPLETALEDLNRTSCERLTDPLEKRGTRGFYFSEKAGSIVYGDW